MDMRLRQLFGIFFILVIIIVVIYLMMYPSVSDGFIDSGRCGVNMPPCPDQLKCMNGYCKPNVPPVYPIISNLPIKPQRYPYMAN